MNINLLNGIALKNTFNSFGGTNRHTQEEKLIEDLSFLLTQEKGKFYPDPEFGSNLYSFLFSPLTEETGQKVKQEVFDVVSKYYPQLTINYINVNLSNKAISIELNYSYSDSDNSSNLTVNIINRDYQD